MMRNGSYKKTVQGAALKIASCPVQYHLLAMLEGLPFYII